MLQAKKQKARKIIEQNLKDDWKKSTDMVLYHQNLPYILEIVKTKLIKGHYDEPLAGYIGIQKKQELLVQNTAGQLFGTMLTPM